MSSHTTALRNAPCSEEPGFYSSVGLWLYGNLRVLHGRLAYVANSLGTPEFGSRHLMEIEAEAERLVLAGFTLVCGIHNEAQQRVAVVPLRWGSPRVLVLSGGFKHHLGPELNEEPFRIARLWRYAWDRCTDLAISRRAPNKLPTFARHNPTVDRLIAEIAEKRRPVLCSPFDSLTPILRT